MESNDPWEYHFCDFPLQCKVCREQMTLDCSYIQLSKTCMVRGNRSHYLLLQETSQGGLNIYTAFYDIRVAVASLTQTVYMQSIYGTTLCETYRNESIIILRHPKMKRCICKQYESPGNEGSSRRYANHITVYYSSVEEWNESNGGNSTEAVTVCNALTGSRRDTLTATRSFDRCSPQVP